jgi:hypothetical protein
MYHISICFIVLMLLNLGNHPNIHVFSILLLKPLMIYVFLGSFFFFQEIPINHDLETQIILV